ncbi:tRNA (N6-threonylcarbamoyladenosine(37)-N6)-methyltransferase TrmO [Tetragenococcus halophilus]|uniref:TsaA-like domain-containing protein n=2 Tax=Tetragenococcus halophilus TaxID=51669 RepID=A0AAN1SHX6_TETHN|nr:tRNA (N6-threonylcarbamoyladenosine(37)-N6)-methyltransferase TrmO [Tetragenococcus halophilus]MCO7026032.1 tRNA (N6-threonylcarbamoyladenosine(37)-N6)-methyltransferase TrmO [Tetragenococcus halophilus]NRR75582.1 tRNA (N6-threonylcarbamoyladenosine(37)-N6)-methyltransferase TrmO [Tetragenococcus halophilus]NWN99772.1 tRNA (N6-threonylcarbamoyladenosine(37)-N6)-methyltransferase TrmO [Tetragenococcus halophilus]QGP77201.1 tRNA (N6-threonylcarbamoyladenosine(37)-N6)-methyltransferase TrmO [Te
MKLTPIGTAHTEYQTKEEAPKQGKYSDKTATIEIFSEYKKGLEDVSDLEFIVVLYWQDKSDRSTLSAQPPFANREYGVFATRSPNRPNPIALCVCELVSVEDNKLEVTGLDALDGSPILDIKAYSQDIDTNKSVTKDDQ